LRVLTAAELRRATLARQLLLERKKLSPLAVIERVVGMQAQWAPAPYVGIWTRAEGFKRDTLERALRRGEVLRPTVMRGTLHLVTKRDYPMFWHAFKELHVGYGPSSLARGLALLEEARRRAPLTQKEAYAWLGDPNPKHTFRAIKRKGHLLHHPETALWKPTASLLFHAAEAPPELEYELALTQLVHRYLRAFGPATKKDINAWSLLPMGWFTHALEGLPTYLDEAGRTLYDVPRAPLPAADTPAPVRFLPKWDNAILAYEKSARLLPAELRRVVILANGDVAPTVLVDGVVAARWKVDEDERVRVEYLASATRTQKADVADEAARLEAWLAS
jgi:winged helix DNA-binding protein